MIGITLYFSIAYLQRLEKREKEAWLFKHKSMSRRIFKGVDHDHVQV